TDVATARKAIQRNEIYAFLYIPKGTTAQLGAMRQPKISFYYNTTSLTAGSLLYRDLKTISTLGSASAVSTVLSQKGVPEKQIMAMLQPIVVDFHAINNPTVNYNIYLSTMLIPGCLMLFIFLITPYSIGNEIKYNTSKEWLETAGGNVYVALAGKLLPQTLVSLMLFCGYLIYIYAFLEFPCNGGLIPILLLAILAVLSAQGFGAFIFGLMPSLRMSMSTCCLWAVLSYSMVGTAFPVSAMHPALQAIAQLFPLRHYYIIYELNIFNGYSLSYSVIHIIAMIVFAMLPLFVMARMKKAITEYKYTP
ncbi:MAG: ABC transporter permease, partial [Prevotella sp.]